jgi:serine/threonine-protein kinase
MDGQPVTFPTIPNYRLEEKLGEGGMGTVYRATQLDPRRTVAVKLLNPLPGGQAPVCAFLREVNSMAALAHPGVVAIHDCGHIDGRLYLVVEYVAGPNLRALMQPGRPWPADRAGVLLDRIARALAFIHSVGFLHLDLKPENVLLAGDTLTPKITDFGLAQPHGDASTLSELGLAEGTVEYCSPEQRYGLPVDARSDLFALATLAYELLTGQLPGRVYVPATRRNPLLPSGLDEVLRRGLARDPEERYRTVEDFRADLNRAFTQKSDRTASAPAGF